MVQDECTETTHRKRAQKAHRIPPKEKTLKKVTLYQPQRPSAALLKTNGNPRRKGPAPPRSTILPATLLRTLHLVSFRHRAPLPTSPGYSSRNSEKSPLSSAGQEVLEGVDALGNLRVLARIRYHALRPSSKVSHIRGMVERCNRTFREGSLVL